MSTNELFDDDVLPLPCAGGCGRPLLRAKSYQHLDEKRQPISGICTNCDDLLGALGFANGAEQWNWERGAKLLAQHFNRAGIEAAWRLGASREALHTLFWTLSLYREPEP